MEERKNDGMKSVFHIEDLKKGSVCGVLEVLSFTPAEISLKITAGKIDIRGGGLEVKSFNVETGDLTFEGDINSIALATAKTSFFQRLSK